MKIDPSIKGINTNNLSTAPLNENRPAKTQSQPGSAPAAGELTLSDLSTQLKNMEAQLAAIPVIDRSRVDAIKQAIASGQYTINPENIAAGLIDSSAEMFRIIK